MFLPIVGSKQSNVRSCTWIFIPAWFDGTQARKAEVEQDVAKAQEKMEEAMTEMAKIKGQETETVVKEKAWLATAHETRGAWYHARSALELARKAFFSQISIEL